MSILTKGYSIGSQVYGGVQTLGNLYEQFFGSKEELGRRGKLDEFASNFQSQDLARPAHFRMRIMPSTPSSKFNSLVGREKINMLCDTADWLDVAVESIEHEVNGDDPFSIAIGHKYGEFNATFYVHADMFQKKFFDDWITLMILDNDQVSYFKDYVTTVEMFQLKHTLDYKNLNEETDWTYKVSITDVYPISVSMSDGDWGNSNGTHKLSVKFHFTNWEGEVPPIKHTT
jgi:hypothetical protein